MHIVYILENPEGKLYIGQTYEINQRLEKHNSGGSNFTKGKGPWNLVHQEEYTSQSEALQREKYLKNLKNSKFIKSYIINKMQITSSYWGIAKR